MNATMQRALRIMDRSGFTFLSDSEVGKGPMANKRAFNALERLGCVTTSNEGFGLVWRMTDKGRAALADLAPVRT